MPKHRSPVTALFAALCAALLSAACVGSSSPAAPVYYYTLDYAPPAPSRDRPLPYVLRVARFTAAPPFNTQRIIYADKGLHRNAYASSHWIAPPGEMLAYSLARDLQQANAFQAVLWPDAALPSTHVVKGWVENFIEEGSAQPAQAVVRLNITLIDAREPDPGARVLFQKSYGAQAPCAEKTPAALARAMSTAAARLSGDIAGDIYSALALVKTAH
jgi:ABC-type uncharacterized transport system auxiliary subunit